MAFIYICIVSEEIVMIERCLQSEMDGYQDYIFSLDKQRSIGIVELGDHQGFPVLYCHGFPSSRLEAIHLHDTALSLKCRLISIDRPGMGLSTPVSGSTILAWAQDVKTITELLELKQFSILGYSGGAAYAAACALNIPDKIHKVGIVSGMAPLSHKDAKASMSREQRIIYQLVKYIPPLASVAMRMTRYLIKHPNKMMKQVAKQLSKVDQEIFADPSFRHVMLSSVSAAFSHGLNDAANEFKLLFSPWGFNLGDIHCPIYLYYGEQDTQVPLAHAQIYANAIENSRLEVFPDEGHHSLLYKKSTKILQDIIR